VHCPKAITSCTFQPTRSVEQQHITGATWVTVEVFVAAELIYYQDDLP
jgi:hypothetical protein